MKYILKDYLALRSWIDCPNAIISEYKARATKIGREKLELLKKCDGVSDIEAIQNPEYLKHTRMTTGELIKRYA